MLARIQSAAVRGVEGFLVGVELDIAFGLPAFTTVGLPDSSVREARERVVAAVRNSGFEFPEERVTVNLSPAELRKAGTQLDLPMGLGALMASGQVRAQAWARAYCFLGELALDGSIRAVSGTLAMAAAARAQGVKGVVLPEANAAEAAAAGVTACGVATLREAAELLRRSNPPPPTPPPSLAPARKRAEDLGDVKGQLLARRALEIAAAGGHNLLLVGPPGAGKSMLARRLPGILPPLSAEESLDVTRIFSVAGLLPPGAGLVTERPLRAPHHTASLASLTGGGPRCRPGELSLAHHGVLFLDELPEFSRPLLETLRQPLEDQRIMVCRVRESVEFPADFMLVAAMNPCPCGYRGHPVRPCRCPASALKRYRTRLSGPLIDRIDLQVELASLSFEDWTGKERCEGSDSVAQRVWGARQKAMARAGCLSARLSSSRVLEHCALDGDGRSLAESSARKLGLSARTLDRLLRVSRTIADLDGSEGVRREHLAEALQYRALDRPLENSL